MKQGSLIVQMIGGRTKIVDFGTLNSSIVLMKNVSSSDLVPGNYEIKLNYRHPESLAFNEQFLISRNSMNVTFVDVDPLISFKTCRNIFNLNEIISIEIRRSSPIANTLSHFFKCKFGNNFINATRIDDSNFICNVSSSLPGVQFLSLWYKDSKNEILLSPNSLRIIFMEKILLNSVNPFTTVVGVSSESILISNFKYDYYSGNVTYRCKFGNEFSTATFQGNEKFSCSMLTFQQIARNESLTLQMRSQDCNSWVDFSSNSLQYIFRIPVEIITISPFAKGYSGSSDMFLDISLTLKPGHTLVNDRGIICKFNSSRDGFAVSQAKVEGNAVICEVKKSNFKDSIEYLHVGLALDTLLFASNDSFISNKLKFVFYKQPLQYKSLNVFNDSLTGNFEIDLPVFESDFEYKIIFKENYANSPTQIISCSKGSQLECKPFSPLQRILQPASMNVSLSVTKLNTPGVEAILSMKSIVYYNRNFKMEFLAPYVLSTYGSYSNPSNVLFKSINYALNPAFQMNCINATNGKVISSSNVIYFGPSTISSISCDVKSQRRSENLPLAISFELNNTNYQMTENMNIKFIETVLIDNYFGFKSGKTSFKFKYPFSSFSGTIKTDYNISVKYDEFGSLKSLKCSKLETQDGFSCESPSIESKTFPRSIQFSIFVDDQFSLTLHPWFKYLEVPTISNILPSRLIDIYTVGKTIKLQSTAFSPNDKNQKYKIRYEELDEIQECVMENANEIQCPISRNTLKTGEEISLKVSIDGTNYESLNKKLYLYTNDINSDKSILLPANTLSPVSVSNSNRRNISMLISIPSSISLPIQTIFVRFKDQFIEEIVTGIIENGKILFELPHFGKYNVQYPRNLIVDASIDGEQYFGERQSIQLNGFEKVKLFPTLFTYGSLMKFSFVDFPFLNLKNERMTLKLVSQTFSIEFNCSLTVDSCESTFQNAPVGVYSLQLYLGDSRFYVPLSHEKVTIFPKPILDSLTFTKISRFMQNSLFLTGTGFSQMKDTIKIRGTFDGKISMASSVIVSDRIGFKFQEIKRSMKRMFSLGNKLEISYNEGVNYDLISNAIELIEDFTFDKISVDVGDPNGLPTTFSFQNTTLKLHGTNLNASSVIQLESDLFSFTTKSSSQGYNFINVVIPEFVYFAPSLVQFSFPIFATIGISLNDGIDFKKRNIVISDRFSSLYLVSISPSIGDRRTRNITMKGASLNEVLYCEFRDKNQVLIETYNIYHQGSEIICPFFYQSKFDNLNEVYISLVNRFNNTSEQQKFTIIGIH
jgi:hypothetical protein